MHTVLVVGAGPVGLTMAAELARHGIACRIVDRLEAPLPYCRAIGVTPRTLEVWDDMGLARDMVDAGLWIDGMRSVIHGYPTRDSVRDLSDLPYAELGLPQYETERLLAAHAARFGVAVECGVALTGLEQDDDGVTVTLERAGEMEIARFSHVIGCDGAHSAVRHALGIAFEGEAFPMLFMLGDVHIDWDLPRGTMLRALRLKEDDAPDMFIAVPLPELGRYRVSTLAPQEMAGEGGSDHGIQSERRGPDLAAIQAVADGLLPERATLADLRWSSTFRISMRLAERYREGRVFIAGDAAHIHPPTGGQGMNTGIQDAYNLAWKLALVLRGEAPATLLESYEAERRPVGADVVARTRAASEGFGREQGGEPDRLADTQTLISYRGTGWVGDDGESFREGVPAAGDRAPDATGLVRHNIAFPCRAHDLLRGTGHVLLAHFAQAPSADDLASLSRFAGEMRELLGDRLRVTAVAPAGTKDPDLPALALYTDADGAFAPAYGAEPAVFLIRPDGHIAWRARSWRDESLARHLARTFTATT